MSSYFTITTYSPGCNFYFHVKTARLETVEKLGKVGANEVSLKFLAAPINPSDLNLVCLMFLLSRDWDCNLLCKLSFTRPRVCMALSLHFPLSVETKALLLFRRYREVLIIA